MFWDYHVLLVHAGRVYDYDTTLPWGCTAVEYCTRAIRPSVEFRGADTAYEPLFRIVRLQDYLRYFASDRSHMPACPAGTEGAGTPHPSWPLLRGPAAESGMTLPLYWTMTTGEEAQRADGERGDERAAGGSPLGQVRSRAAFQSWCAEQVQRWP
jgi:hypothetical protein